MSSQDVIKSTAKKLKYYMDVKRLEDAFDLSGTDKPQRHYPTLKPRPTLLYDGLHDRALKHYFRSPEVKKHLNNMNPRPSHNVRESKIKKDVDNYMSKSKFTGPYSTLVKPRSSPKKRKNNFRGGPILMRSRHGPYLSKGETERLVNAATRLLVASEQTVPIETNRSKTSKSLPVYRSSSGSELPLISRTSSAGTQMVPRKPDRPKSNYGRTSSPSRPKSALVGRPKSAGGRLKSKEDPSSTRYGYDMYGQRVRIHKQQPLNYESSESESEDYDDESLDDGMTNFLVPVSGGRGQQTPEWLNIQMSKVEVDDGIDSDEEDPREEESNADAASVSQEDPNLYSLDMCTQTGREICTQTVEKPDNTQVTQTRRGDDEECMTDPYQADMAIQTKAPPTTLSTQTYDPPPEVSTQTIPPPPTMSTQTYPEISTQTTPVDNMETQTEIHTPSVGIQCTPPDPPHEIGIQCEPVIPPPEIGIQCEPPKPAPEIGIQAGGQTQAAPAIATQYNAPSPPSSPAPSSSRTQTPLVNYDYLKHGPRLKSGKRTIYELAIHTGEVLGAGTKADIHIILYGEKGNTGKIKLKQTEEEEGRRMKFQKGQIDVFKVESYNVGKLECISVGHNRNDIGCGWYLAKVMVNESGNNIRYEFNCDRWMSAQNEDGKTVRTLPVSNVIMDVDDSDDDDDYDEQTADSSDYSDSDVRLAQTPDGRIVALVPSERASQASGRSRPSSRRSAREPESSSSESESEDDEDYSDSDRSDSEDDDDSGSGSGSGSSSGSSSGSGSESGSSDSGSDSEDDRRADGDSRGGRSSRGGRYKDRSGHTDTPDGAAAPSMNSEPLTPTLDSNTEQSVTTSSSSQVSSSSSSGNETAAESNSERPKERKNDSAKPKPDYMDGFKAGMKANLEKQRKEKEREEEERRKKEEERERQRQAEERLLQGPSIYECCKDGNLDRLKQLVQHNAELKNTPDERGWKPLHVASSRGHLDIVKWLAANEVKLDDLTPTGYTALHMAAMNGHLNVIMVLSAMGSHLSSKTVDEQTPLHLASMSGHTECCKWLVANRAPLDAIDNMGRTALDLAEEYQHKDVEAFIKSCRKELTRSDSSLSQLRSRSPSMSSQAAGSESKVTESEGWAQDSKSGDERASSRGEDDVADQNEETDKRQLLVRKKSFHEQQERMNTEGKSFLESIQDEIARNTEQQA